MESKKNTKSKAGAKPAHTIRKGAIAANIWKRQTQTGFTYFEYSLSRSWKSQSSEREGYSTNFFPRNEEAIGEVVKDASAWIEAQNPDEAEADAFS